MIETRYRITCDSDTCPAVWPTEDWATSLRRTWKEARAAGWGHDYDRVLCPEHSPDAALVARIRRLAGTMPDALIGQRLGLSRSQVQYLRSRYEIAGLREGRPSVRYAGVTR